MSLRSLAAGLPLALLLLAPVSARADDTAAPEMTHTPVEKAEKGKPVRIQAHATDASKFFPQVFYRWDGAAFGKGQDMKKMTGKKNKDQYQFSIPGKGDVLEYYLEAYDEFGNGPTRVGSPEQPFKVEATAAVAEAPKEEPPTAAPTTDAPKEAPAAVAEAAPKETPPPAAVEAPKPKRTAPRAATETTTASMGSGGASRTWTWVAGGVGAGLLVGGLLTGLAVKKADDAYSAQLADKTSDPRALQQQYDANKSLGTTATLMTVGGLVLIAGGTALYFLEPGWNGSAKRADNADPTKKDQSKMAFAATPLNGGAAAVVAGTF